jgi:hypothetical protein
MSKKNKGPQADRAVPTVRTPRRRDTEKVDLTNSLKQSLKASPDWAQATTVQTAFGSLDQDAQKLAAITAQVEGLKGQLRTALTQLVGARRDWGTSLKQLLGTVEVYSKGSVDVVKGFGLEVRSAKALGTLPAPANLVLARGKEAGTVTAKWDKGTSRIGFLVQHATDPANAATFSTPKVWTKTKYTLDGLPSGSTVYFRVAAVDPSESSGQSPYTAWASGVAR